MNLIERAVLSLLLIVPAASCGEWVSSPAVTIASPGEDALMRGISTVLVKLEVYSEEFREAALFVDTRRVWETSGRPRKTGSFQLAIPIDTRTFRDGPHTLRVWVEVSAPHEGRSRAEKEKSVSVVFDNSPPRLTADKSPQGASITEGFMLEAEAYDSPNAKERIWIELNGVRIRSFETDEIRLWLAMPTLLTPVRSLEVVAQDEAGNTTRKSIP